MTEIKPGHIALFILYYEQYFRITLGWKHFKLAQKPRTLKLIENFLKRAVEHYKQPRLISSEFLKFYFEFAFGHNATRTFKGKRVITVLNIVEKKVWLLFLESTKGQKWGKRMRMVRNSVAFEHDIAPWELRDSPAQIEKNTEERAVYSSLPTYEEKDRSLFFNTMKGYLWCANETTMFHPQSEHCPICKFLEQCKTRQAENFPALSELRKKL